jgi:hypothetical protein
MFETVDGSVFKYGWIICAVGASAMLMFLIVSIINHIRKK